VNTPLKRFASWCIQANGWWWWRFDLSWLVTTRFGAKAPEVIGWSEPLLEAFLAGAWMLHWTADTLYWVAKPIVHVEKTATGRRLHNEAYAALESDVENLYFWHGVLVPAFVVVRPDWITQEHIGSETNAEVRRVMIERYGADAYLLDSGANVVQRDLVGLLYRKDIPNDEPLVMVRVLNSTPEPDGVMSRDEAIEAFGEAAAAAINSPVGSRFKQYMIRVPPTVKTAREAVAWTFGLKADEYAPELET
jgi:hypothetical protein